MSPYDVASFDEFWPHYVRMHSRRATQIAHAAASLICVALLAAAVAARAPLLAALAPLADFAIAQTSHRLFQRNRTTPLRHPLWHARAEVRMLGLVLTGRMGRETRLCG